MKRAFLAIVAVLAIALAGSASVSATQHDPDHKVGICHRTASDTNPYVYIEVDEVAVSAHIGESAHPSKDGRNDYLAPNGEVDCNVKEVTPSSSPSSPSPEPSGSPSVTPEPTPSATPSASPNPSTRPSVTPSPTRSPHAPVIAPPTDTETAATTDSDSDDFSLPIFILAVLGVSFFTAHEQFTRQYGTRKNPIDPYKK